jgi:hypothetical protein
MAIDYLTIPGNVVGYFVCFTSLTCCVAATSVDVKRLFSCGRLILPHMHSRLAVTSAQALLCLGSWSLKGLVMDEDVTAVGLLDEVEGRIELDSAGFFG